MGQRVEAVKSALTVTQATNDGVTCYISDPNRLSNGDIGYTVASKGPESMGKIRAGDRNSGFLGSYSHGTE